MDEKEKNLRCCYSFDKQTIPSYGTLRTLRTRRMYSVTILYGSYIFFFFIALAGDESRLFDYVVYIRRPISGAQLRRKPYYYLEAVLSDVHATTREQKKRKI